MAGGRVQLQSIGQGAASGYGGSAHPVIGDNSGGIVGPTVIAKYIGDDVTVLILVYAAFVEGVLI